MFPGFHLVVQVPEPTAVVCVVLQCSALQAQVIALTEQNEQHIEDRKKNMSQMSGVEVATTDSSEKVSW